MVSEYKCNYYIHCQKLIKCNWGLVRQYLSAERNFWLLANLYPASRVVLVFPR